MQQNRRGFLRFLSRTLASLSLGSAWAKGLGIFSFISAGFAFLWRRGQALQLDAGRIPIWHPQCSGHHTDRCLTVRKQISSGRVKELVLTGAPARLWCLCAGGHSETTLVNVLVRERGLDAATARRQVAAFLDRLYRHGFLTRASAGELVAQNSNEVEGTSTRGEQAWQQLTG